MKKHIVIGHGEIGTAVAELLNADWVDLTGSSGNLHPQYEYLNICIPWGDSFIHTVQECMARYSPRLTIVHSTVPIGTCDTLGVCHSPVRGVHPHLLESLKTFVKMFGGEGSMVAADEFERFGVDTMVAKSARDTEAMKLWSTTQYGVSIRLMQEIHKFCEEHDLDFDTVYKWGNKTYNSGYFHMDKPQFMRPVLKYMGEDVGGHCVLNNAKLLDSPSAKLVLGEWTGSGEVLQDLLEMAVFWMRKSQDYSPPRPQDVGRMLKCADYIEERLKERSALEETAKE